MKGIQKRPLAVEVFLAGKNLLRTGYWKTPLYTNSTQETVFQKEIFAKN
jgi:hypothetical protein